MKRNQPLVPDNAFDTGHKDVEVVAELAPDLLHILDLKTKHAVLMQL